MDWTSEHDFTLDGVQYRALADRTDDDQMVLLKPRRLVETYEQMVKELRPQTIFELGIFAGGSAALLAQIAKPERLVAIERNPKRCVPLDRFIDTHGLHDVVKPHYGIDQADGAALDAIMASDFDGPLDLVIDDASHLEPQSRASFNRLFPYLRPGGKYIIEDWSWPHIAAMSAEPAYQGVTPLSVLVCELVLAVACRRKAITNVEVGPDWAMVTRGPAVLRPGIFDLSAHFDPVGTDMVERIAQARTLA